MLLALVAVAAQPTEATEQPPQAGQTATLSLTRAQQQAVGIGSERPRPLTASPQIEAFGTVLDPVLLVTDMGRVESTRVAAAAAAADAERLGRLYRDDMRASLKSLQTAQAQSVEAAAQARAAELTFRLRWGPLADWSSAQQHALVEAASRGQLLLVRADVPGQQDGGAIDRRALVEAGGLSTDARVLGRLPRSDPPARSAGWLLQLERSPPVIGPGARVAVRLRTAAVTGLLVPAAALLYGEEGVYVYRQLDAGSAGTLHYVAVPVRLLARVGSAWLVDGISASDRVVVEGAGVLWSLQGLGTFSAAEEEHD